MASNNTTDPTVTDPRVEHIAAFTGLEPADVLNHVQADAAEHGDTVEEELQEDVETVGLIEALGDI